MHGGQLSKRCGRSCTVDGRLLYSSRPDYCDSFSRILHFELDREIFIQE